MFNDRKKPDSKIRWQNPRFRGQLREARSYKRPVKLRPPSVGGIFLSKIGLGTWPRRLITAAILLFLVYLVYIPNVFFIKKININGGRTEQITTLINLYLNKKTPWPQKNLLLMSKNGLANFLQTQDRQILKVSLISKKLPNTLTVNFIPRVDEYLLQTASSTNFSISTDGLVTGQIFPDASGTLPVGLKVVKLDQNPYIFPGQKLFTDDEANFFQSLQDHLPGIAKSPIDHYELPDLENGDINAYLKSGFLLKFNLDFGSDEMLNRLSLLFSQMSVADFKSLYYVDLRFKDRAYTCEKNAPCVNSQAVPNNSTASTTLIKN